MQPLLNNPLITPLIDTSLQQYEAIHDLEAQPLPPQQPQQQVQLVQPINFVHPDQRRCRRLQYVACAATVISFIALYVFGMIKLSTESNIMCLQDRVSADDTYKNCSEIQDKGKDITAYVLIALFVVGFYCMGFLIYLRRRQ